MRKIDLSQIRMGTDAEFFLFDQTGRPFPVCGIVGGTKESPIPLSDDGCAVQEDNVMLEINTPICSDAGQWVKNLRRARDLAFARVPPSLVPKAVASVNIDKAYIDAIPQSRVFGCEPDYNAWLRERNPRPKASDETLRTAAAHVHISWPDVEDMDQRCRVIQMCDIFVSLPNVFTHLTDAGKKRREMYGKAGAFRPKDYGVEHRVLDNEWMGDVYRMEDVWHQYQTALSAVNTDYVITEEEGKNIQEAINTGNYDLAFKVSNEMQNKIFPRAVASTNAKKKSAWIPRSRAVG